jgi:hypothetical protein
VNELIAYFRELEVARDDTKRSEGDLAAEIASDCVKPLMPTLLSSLVGGDRDGERGGPEADDMVLAQRLVRLIEALPERALNQVAVAIAGPLIRAYSTRSVSLVAESRAAILRALEVLGARAPGPLKVNSLSFSEVCDKENSCGARGVWGVKKKMGKESSCVIIIWCSLSVQILEYVLWLNARRIHSSAVLGNGKRKCSCRFCLMLISL